MRASSRMSLLGALIAMSASVGPAATAWQQTTEGPAQVYRPARASKRGTHKQQKRKGKR